MDFSTSLAIIGASCRLPGAETLPAFAQMLLAGRSAVREVPEDRWTSSRYYHPAQGQSGKTYSFAAGALPEVFAFDAAFFGISPREAPSIDPQQRLMLEVAYEAIEDAGIPHSSLAGTGTGVFVGASSWDFAATSFSDAASLDAYGMQGAALSSVANRLSYIFDLRGPSLTVDTACSSSLVALHLACEALRRDEIDQAVVGGVNLLIAPQSFVGFARASMLSRLGRCHSFDARADGYVRGEGAGALVVKTLSRALADGDPIRAVIRGTGVNSDGRTNAFPVPSRMAQAALLREVRERAGVEPDEFSYFEAHGTGTPVGDPIEAHAIGEALAQLRSAPLLIGSVKSNVGHLEPASGIAGLMKLLVAFDHGIIPPSLNFETPNPHIPFDTLKLQVVTKPRQIATGSNVAVCGINSFGFGGTNAHAILSAPEHAEDVNEVGTSPSTEIATPLLLSARSTEALRELAGIWHNILRDKARTPVPALVRAAARNRDQLPHRMVITPHDSVDYATPLSEWLGGTTSGSVKTGHANPGDVAFVYSGNGSQWAGMGLDALRGSAPFRTALARVDDHLAAELGWSVTERLQSEDLAETLHHTAVAQPLLFALQVAVVITLRELGVHPAAHIGHSAGEVAAAWASGALTLEQACHVIIQRSLLQDTTHGHGGMAALSLGEAAAKSLIARIDPDLAIAAINAAGAVTVAGPKEALDSLEAAAREMRARCSRLDLEYAFHSPTMEPIRQPLLKALAGLQSAAPGERMVSTVTGDMVTAGELDAEYWWRNVRLPVRFSDAISQLAEQGVRTFVEIGPLPILQHYLRETLRGNGESRSVLSTLSRRSTIGDPLAAAAAECHVAGANIGKAARFDGTAHVRGLPMYPWQRTRYIARRSAEAIELNAPLQDHPLLGFRDPAVSDAWMSHLSTASEPWLADHIVNGTVVLPAAAMIEMAFAAARVRHPDAPVLEIQDLEITRSLALDPNTTRDCRITVEADGQWHLASRPRLSEEVLQSHAQGRILPGLGDRALLTEAGHDGGDAIDGDVVYARAKALNLVYGPAFRTVTRVRRVTPTMGIATLQAVDATRAAGQYLLDPAIVDGSLQALLVMVAGDPAMSAMGTVVPWRFGRIRLLRQGHPQPTRAMLYLRHTGPRSICADIALTTDAGETVVELLDCWFVAVPGGSAGPADQTFWTAYIPSLHQPPVVLANPIDRVLAATVGADDVSANALLADACVTATAHEALLALNPDGVLPDTATHLPLVGLALSWLQQEGLAERTASGWRIHPESELPPAVEIWRSLFFGAASGGAESALLAALGPSLAACDGAGLLLPPVLREQAMFASPSAIGAAEALLSGLAAFTTKWPAERCLRLALVGMPQSSLVRRILDQIETAGLPLRLVVLTADADLVPAVQAELARVPGAAVQSWGAVHADGLHNFDLVLNIFGLSLPGRERLTPHQLLELLTPAGLLLAAEPMPGRVADVLFGPGMEHGAVAATRHPETWCHDLRDAGFGDARHSMLDGAIWPVALMVASAADLAHTETIVGPESTKNGLVLFAAPNDPLAAALAARQTVARQLPIEALREVLTGPFAAQHQHVLLLAEDMVEDDAGPEALAELLADISTALNNMMTAQTTRLWLVSAGSPAESLISAALTGLRRVAGNEMSGLECRAVALDTSLPATVAADRLLQELHEPDQEREVFWSAAGRMVPRLRATMPNPPRSNGPRRLEVLRPGLINTLAWMPMQPPAIGPGEVAIEVHAAALNFRDVMWAQGMLPDEALLEGFSGPSLGLECAGLVTAVGAGVDDLRPGDRVAAVAPAALATHVITPRNGVLRMPADMPFAAAATIPVAFMTAAYGLGYLARLQPGETVLIHGGAGGVGLAAIQYALHKGAVVYATAGSEMRRQILRMLGVAAVFDSRGTSFADDVLAATGGKGVDVVLNSLNQELMKQSLRLLRPFGRFLEIGKRDLYRNTAIGIRSLRHNASYFAIDVDELVAHRPAIGMAVLREVSELLEVAELQPLPYRTFGFADVVAAFRLLQSSGHIGKVVLEPTPTPSPAPAIPFRLRTDGVYLVTGGLSGFGLETARWLIRQGARDIALFSRRGAATPGAADALAKLAADGVRIRAFACDVAEPGELQPALKDIRRTMGPIRGIFHAAMVLDDGLLRDLDAARFTAVIRPKLAGALALDRLTRSDDLDLFVMFSSVTTVIGTPGQANYIAANRTLEALAERRRAVGLPALAVQWGPIGDAGYLTRETRVSEMLAKMLGSSHLTAQQALDALPSLLASGLPVIGLADVAWAELRSRLPGLAGSFWAEMPLHDRGSLDGQPIRSRLTQMSPDEAAVAIQEILVEEIARILQQPPAAIHIDRPIQEFGVDSLMAVELQTALEGRLGIQPSLMALTGAGTLRAIATKLLQGMDMDSATKPEDDVVTTILRHEAETAGAGQDAAVPPA